MKYQTGSVFVSRQDRIEELADRRNLSLNYFFLFVLILLHIPLTFLIKTWELASTIHALAIFLLGVILLIRRKGKPDSIVHLTAYLASAEVLWRMTNANVFWEFGKYAISLLLGLSLLKWRYKVNLLPFWYFILLVPSVILTLNSISSTSVIRDLISFNLSGPLCLMIAVIFFSNYRFTNQNLSKTLLFGLMPVVSIATLALSETLSNQFLIFTLHSNLVTSGGYGPNQVSAILSAGVLIVWAYLLITPRIPFLSKLFLVGLFIWFLTQSMLTFSRGGLFNLLLAIPIASLYLLYKNPRLKSGLFWFFIGIIIFLYLIYPWLDTWTNYLLGLRYRSFDTSGRLELIQLELEIWRDNLLYGVGPGMSARYLAGTVRQWVSAHTEYSRMLAEHGFFGLSSLVLLCWIAVKTILKAPQVVPKALALAFLFWSFTEMSHSAMRIVIIQYMIALPTGFSDILSIKEST